MESSDEDIKRRRKVGKTEQVPVLLYIDGNLVLRNYSFFMNLSTIVLEIRSIPVKTNEFAIH